MGSTGNALVAKAERQLSSIENDLSNLSLILSSPVDSGILATARSSVSEMGSSLATATLSLRSLEEALSRETSMDKRQYLKEKHKQFKAKHQELKDRFDQMKAQMASLERTTQRTALLGPPSGTPQSSTQMTEELLRDREDSTLRYAENRISEYIAMGTSTLDSLRLQKSTLKGAQRRVLDASSRLGISQSLMKIIQRKTNQDRYIFYTGVIVIFLVIYFCWRYIL